MLAETCAGGYAPLRTSENPYKGGAPAINDLIGGHLPMLINSLPDMLEQHRGGRLRIIATTGRERSPLTPEVPTLTELGIPMIADIGIDITRRPAFRRTSLSASTPRWRRR
jgi:tripartite-type tricarboxylate transporter receptor subunit TctC